MADAGGRFRAGLIIALMVAGAATTARAEAPTALGQWAELRTRGHEFPLFKVKHHHILEYTDDAAWHPATQQLLFVGQGHISPPLKFVVYSARTNRWRLMPIPPWAVGVRWGHGYDNNAIDIERGLFYHHRSRSRRLQVYDIAAGSWTALPENRKMARGHGTAIAYFPEMEALVRVLGGTIHLFEVGPRRWQVLASGLVMGKYHNVAKYSVRHRAVILGGGGQSPHVYMLRADGRPTRLSDAPMPFGIYNSRATVVDPVSGDFIVLTRSGPVHALDVRRDRWRHVAPTNPIGNRPIIATPVPDHGIIMFVTIRPEKVYLYRHRGGAEGVPPIRPLGAPGTDSRD